MCVQRVYVQRRRRDGVLDHWKELSVDCDWAGIDKQARTLSFELGYMIVIEYRLCPDRCSSQAYQDMSIK